MRRTKMVCTIGPSSSSPDRVARLVDAGMDVARLNFSHGSHEIHQNSYETVRVAAAEAHRNVAILMDLQGPKIRTGKLKGGGPVELEAGNEVRITTAPVEGDASLFSTTYTSLPADVSPGHRILIADGVLELSVEGVDGHEILCRVVQGGELGEHKGINLPGVPVSAPSLTEKDVEDLEFGLQLGVDYVGLSFVRKPEDVRDVKQRIKAAGKNACVIAKIERPEALDCFDAILDESDAIMVARGDLGVEVDLEDVPQIQKEIIRKCNRAGVPVITATQMLESMMTNPRPTRAEANDVANAIYDGTDAVMLSGETAAGGFPIRAAEVMAHIAEKADEAIARQRPDIETGCCESLPYKVHALDNDHGHADAIGRAVYEMSYALPIRHIICFTKTGYTASMIARYRPVDAITAITLGEEAQRRCALYWGVDAIESVDVITTDEMGAVVDDVLMERGLAEPGETVVIVAGTPLALAGVTNLLRLHRVGSAKRTWSLIRGPKKPLPEMGGPNSQQ